MPVNLHRRNPANLRHSPRFTIVKKCFKITIAHAFSRRTDLIRHQIFVTRVPDTAENADGVWHVRRVAHPCEEVRQGGVLGVLIVNDEIIGGVFAVCGFDDFGLETVESDTLIVFRTEDERFPVFQNDRVVSFRIFFRVLDEGFVVEHIAVLIDFDKRSAFVFKR